MVEENVSEAGSQPTRGKGGVVGPIVFICLALTLGAGTGGYLLVCHFRQAEGNTGSSEKKAAVDKENEIGPKDRFEYEQERQLLRAELRDWVEQGNLIRQNIDALEKNIGAYEQGFEELKDSDVAQRLVKNDQAVRYFFDGQLRLPPGRALVKAHRAKLDVLMSSAEEALSKPDMAFAVSGREREAVDLTRREVDMAREEYNRHRLLLDGLMRLATEEDDGEPGVREDTAASEEDRFMLEELLGNVEGKNEDAEEPSREEAVETVPEMMLQRDELFRELVRKALGKDTSESSGSDPGEIQEPVPQTMQQSDSLFRELERKALEGDASD